MSFRLARRIDSPQRVINHSFCVVKPGADAFDRQAVKKIGSMVKSIAASPPLVMAAQRQLVNDEHYGSAFGCHPFVSALAGKVKQKFAPRGELLAAHKRPPCDSMMERLMRSPMPVP